MAIVLGESNDEGYITVYDTTAEQNLSQDLLDKICFAIQPLVDDFIEQWNKEHSTKDDSSN